MIDTHQHLFLPDKFGYAWADDFPALQGSFTHQDYWDAAADTGITHTLFVEVDVDEQDMAAEAAYFCCMAEDPSNKMLGVIAASRPEHANFESHLDRLAHPKCKGIRRVLHNQPDTLLQSEQLRLGLGHMGRRQLPFDLIVQQHQLPLACALVEDCADTRFVLDHLGNPRVTDNPKDFQEWEKSIRAIAAAPNVYCKISGIIAWSDPKLCHAQGLRPWIETAVDAFGWHRVLFGGDWPVCNVGSDLLTWVNLLNEVFAGASTDELARFYCDNALEAYQLDCDVSAS